jgi:hypothetical protein
VLADANAAEGMNITFSSKVSFARMLSALEYVILSGVYTNTIDCQL